MEQKHAYEGIDPVEPLTLDTSPSDPDDEAIHALVDEIEVTLLPDTSPNTTLSARFRTYLRHLVYLAVTSEDEYTLTDLVDLIDDEHRYAQFWSQLDEGNIDPSVASFGQMSPRLRDRVGDVLDPTVHSARL